MSLPTGNHHMNSGWNNLDQRTNLPLITIYTFIPAVRFRHKLARMSKSFSVDMHSSLINSKWCITSGVIKAPRGNDGRFIFCFVSKDLSPFILWEGIYEAMELKPLLLNDLLMFPSGKQNLRQGVKNKIVKPTHC